MRAVGLISGGKDSCYNMMQCVAAGHTIVALANLQPQHKDELDSYMYQTVGHQGIDLYAEAMGLPLYRQYISGVAVDQTKNYTPSDKDEVEDLYRLLSRIKDELDIEAVACGAILSDYQRIRVESVCQRLGLVSLAYLWRRNQKELLQEMIASGVEAIIIKVAALGLDPKIHLGMTLQEIQPHLLLMQEKYGLNVCGEGGEYETFTLDCPLFCKRLVVDEKELVIHSEDPVASVGYLNLKLHLEPKEDFDGTIKLPPTVKNSLDFVNDLSDTIFSDISDVELSETELESIEKLEKEEQKKENELNPLLTYSGDGTEGSCNIDDSQNDSTESIEDCYDYDDIMQNECERQPILDHSSIYGNKHGWYFIGGIVGEGVETATATEDAMKKLINLLGSRELDLRDVCSVNIYMRDMEDYGVLNAIYARNFCFPNPPTRVCVQCPLPKDVGVIMDAVAHKATITDCDSDGSSTKERMTMHVQGISHWAPANIGPYSQAFKVGEVAGTSGQIALVPGSMRLAAGGPRAQCALALRHLGRLLRATHPRAHIRSVVQSVCYVAGGGGGAAGAGAGCARRQLERRTAGAIVQCAAVQALPRRAAVEWHAWAHADNNRFDYEETGCNIEEYKVAITRRWNYENTIAAIVCSVATASSPSTSQLSFPDEAACRGHRARAAALRGEPLRRALHYALRKLLNEAPHKELPAAEAPTPALSVRIFYQVWSAPPPEEMVRACAAAAEQLSCAVALTVVPVLALHNAFTFLSISGLRFDE